MIETRSPRGQEPRSKTAPESEGGAAGTAPARTPWIIWAAGMLILAGALTLTVVSGLEAEDRFFLPLAALMIVGYSTVGAVIASRIPRNPMGWLLMAVGLMFSLTGMSDEYAIYTFDTNPGSLPFGRVAALVSTSLWLPMLATMVLLVALFPTGRVPGRRWRLLPPAILGLTALFLIGNALHPGPLDVATDPPVENPTGVQSLRTVTQAAVAIGGVGVLLAAIPSIGALVLRYLRSRDEERQQIRWLAYVAGTTVAVILLAMASGLILGESFGESLLSDLFSYTVLTLIAIGVPAAMGVAILRYRLYDLDIVVRKTVLYAIVAVLLTAIFLVVAVVIGAIAGRSQTGAIVAAAAIGLSFWPALRVARLVADRIVYGARATPYEVLAEFSTRVAESYRAEDVLPRMARILGDAVGATRATVWLRVGDGLRPAAASPPDDAPVPIALSGDELPQLPADASAEVRDRGELLGALSVSMPPNDPINPAKERLVRDLASQAGLVLRNVRLIEELRESRRRIVTAQDERAKKLERDIHDGAQQELVALTVKLRLAEQLAERDAAGTKVMLAQLQGEATDALQHLRDLARGIYPPLLADKGLGAALEAQARKSPVPVELETHGIGRYPPELEAAVYFCVLEALQNVAKYARANLARVELAESDGDLTFVVADDGVGFDPAAVRGSGLTNIRDRIEALGGEVQFRSAAERGTKVSGRVPASTMAHAAASSPL